MLLVNREIWRLAKLDTQDIVKIQELVLDFAENQDLCDKEARFDLELCDDQKIAQLNYEFLACFGPTNILSFPNNNQELGILYLSVDTLQREAILYGQEIDSHFKRLLCHGFAHLLGFDHSEEMDSLCEALEASIDRI